MATESTLKRRPRRDATRWEPALYDVRRGPAVVRRALTIRQAVEFLRELRRGDRRPVQLVPASSSWERTARGEGGAL